MEQYQQSPGDIQKHRALTEEQMERRAKFRGLVALVSVPNGKKRIEFLNHDFDTAINIRRCAVLENRPPAPPPELTRANFVGRPLKVPLNGKKLKPIVAGRSRKAWEATARLRRDIHAVGVMYARW
jgi:hypothetical protein